MHQPHVYEFCLHVHVHQHVIHDEDDGLQQMILDDNRVYVHGHLYIHFHVRLDCTGDRVHGIMGVSLIQHWVFLGLAFWFRVFRVVANCRKCQLSPHRKRHSWGPCKEKEQVWWRIYCYGCFIHWYWSIVQVYHAKSQMINLWILGHK